MTTSNTSPVKLNSILKLSLCNEQVRYKGSKRIYNDWLLERVIQFIHTLDLPTHQQRSVYAGRVQRSRPPSSIRIKRNSPVSDR
ncbi:hypothetical protein CU097_008932 [Rhizopus azygosporus]|uniref:Uncharacterized protein n=1 Tax=Rhizopus azygosporus TaxID=86630 RepID=A0A367K2J9_RHIAZ|nr:hypothetical protein CU097_008932 [Rhizopus azygosporus]CEG70211.1 hypothetical protein RMATCC62417_06149 [Rhizopus microsporus]CEI96179.1 hypothetical protein RMCBS344292_10346 [Rhizopus microsporus]